MAALSPGYRCDQVVAIQGQPTKMINLGAKKTYIYRDMKIVFTDGRVTDIQ